MLQCLAWLDVSLMYRNDKWGRDFQASMSVKTKSTSVKLLSKSAVTEVPTAAEMKQTFNRDVAKTGAMVFIVVQHGIGG